VGNPGAPIQVSEWQAHPTASIHNVTVKGDSAYLSYYTEGLQVLDISDPSVPLPVAWYDTYLGVSGGFRGNWGVWPFARTGAIYLSDIRRGLVVVALTAGQSPADFMLSAPAGQVVLPEQPRTHLFFEVTNLAAQSTTYTVSASNSLGWEMEVPATVTVPGSSTDAVPVTVEVGGPLDGPTRVDVEMCLVSQRSGTGQCAASRLAVPVVLQGFEAQAQAEAVALAWHLAVGGAETGELVLERAAAAGAFAERGRFALGSGAYRDRDVQAGTTYVYRLILQREGAAGRLLGERRVELAAPARSRLFGNAPNPFNPQTRLRFELARAGDVQVTVYDLRGRLVRRIVQPGLEAGRQEIAWDGADGRGRPLPSGIYFYLLRSGAWQARGRMTLAR
jgi:hypothetical protein